MCIVILYLIVAHRYDNRLRSSHSTHFVSACIFVNSTVKRWLRTELQENTLWVRMSYNFVVVFFLLQYILIRNLPTVCNM